MSASANLLGGLRPVDSSTGRSARSNDGATLERRRFLATCLATTAATLASTSTSTRAVAKSIASFDVRPLDTFAFHSERRYAVLKSGRVAYVERGVGPAAVFLHGFPLNGFQWRGALQRLAPFRRCIAPDFLGMGYTQVAEGNACTPEAQVAMLLELFDALGLDQVDLVANDSGGAIAQLLVAGHGERVRSLLLTNCDTEADSPPPALIPVIELARKGRFVEEWLGAWHADRALARSSEGIGGMCYADPANPTDEAIDAYFGPLLSTQQRTDRAHDYALGLERNALLGIGPALRESRIPVRVVWGLADTIFSPQSPHFLARSFGNLQGLRLLADSKLFWPEERPEVIAEEARRLWGP